MRDPIVCFLKSRSLVTSTFDIPDDIGLRKRTLVYRGQETATLFTPCLSTPAECTLEGSPVKICSVKSLSGEKSLDFLPTRKFCINYFTPGKIPHH